MCSINFYWFVIVGILIWYQSKQHFELSNIVIMRDSCSKIVLIIAYTDVHISLNVTKEVCKYHHINCIRKAKQWQHDNSVLAADKTILHDGIGLASKEKCAPQCPSIWSLAKRRKGKRKKERKKGGKALQTYTSDIWWSDYKLTLQ